MNEKMFPTILKCIEKKKNMMKLLITKENICFKSTVYTASDIITATVIQHDQDDRPRPLEESYAEVHHHIHNILQEP